MNDYEKTIEILQSRVRALEQLIQPIGSRPTVKQWQPTGGNFFIQSSGKVSEVVGGSDTLHKEFGVERPTRQQAQRAVAEMRRFNRLLALRDELCGDGESNWGEVNGEYFIYFYNEDERWHADCDHPRYVTPYFTTQELAHRACDMLNSGEVEL